MRSISGSHFRILRCKILIVQLTIEINAASAICNFNWSMTDVRRQSESLHTCKIQIDICQFLNFFVFKQKLFSEPFPLISAFFSAKFITRKIINSRHRSTSSGNYWIDPVTNLKKNSYFTSKKHTSCSISSYVYTITIFEKQKWNNLINYYLVNWCTSCASIFIGKNNSLAI